MPTILIATANRGKAKEIQEIFKNSGFELKFLFDFADELNILENAKTFEGNALIKAIIAGNHFKMLTLADDSGLEVDALDGRPGVYSSRYSGTGQDEDNRVKILEELKGVPLEKRTASYTTVVAIYNPSDNFVETVSASWSGKIASAAKGDNHRFGYAPIFLSAAFNYTKTNAECELSELVKYNSRGQAFRQAIEILKKID